MVDGPFPCNLDGVWHVSTSMPPPRPFVLLMSVTAVLLAQQILSAQQTKMSAAQVVSFVRTSAKTSQDKEVAEYLRKVSMTDRLSDDAIESCIQAGAGPRTRAALMDLGRDSATLPLTKKIVPQPGAAATGGDAQPAPVGPPPPSEEEKRTALEKATRVCQ